LRNRLSFRDLTSLDEFAAVVELEREIWGPGYDDVVPVPILSITVKRGGILIGAFEEDRMVGFVYSIPGIKHNQPTHWSHMLGVIPEFRSAGLGRDLKLLQRERALAMNLELIEWTYDPLQAANAHLNFAKLGVVVDEYEENVYGESASPLHKGNPTDRFVAEWWIQTPRVKDRIGDGASLGPIEHGRPAVPANQAKAAGKWMECRNVDLSIDADRVDVEIPVGFTEMMSQAPDLALAWRMATRSIFTTMFARGYRAVDFVLDRPAGKGTYVLARGVRL
jgi:predicted GNAT superfamily acetyltransferase